MTKLRRAAEGKRCTVRLPGCTDRDAVLAHYGGTRMGGGTGLKVDDLAGAHACPNCHDIVDGRKPRPDWMSKQDVRLAHAEGCIETTIRLRENGTIIVQ